MTIVVMTREMGTLGKEVAREFGRRRNFAVLHHEMIRSQRDREGRDEESEVYRFLEGSEAELDRWRSNRSHDGYLTPAEIVQVALDGDVLIRGWGATRLLRTVPNVLSVRVCAPMDFRIGIMTERLGVDARTARREIERSDAAHSRTFLRFFQSDWRDPLQYDLVFNTAQMHPTACAEMLLDAVADPAFEESERMRQVLNDMLLEERIKAALHAEAGLGRRGQHVDVAVEAGVVRLYGVVRSRSGRQLAGDVVERCGGATGMVNEIAEASGFVE